MRIETADDDAALAALRDRFGIEATVSEGAVTFHVEAGEEFVPRLFAELGVPITSVSVSRPTLDDVFMPYTGTTIRDAEEDGSQDRNRTMMRAWRGRADDAPSAERRPRPRPAAHLALASCGRSRSSGGAS